MDCIPNWDVHNEFAFMIRRKTSGKLFSRIQHGVHTKYNLRYLFNKCFCHKTSPIFKLLVVNQADFNIIWTVCYGGSSNQIS